MTCPRCHKDFADGARRCPHCGANVTADSGLFQTSAVLISSQGEEKVYRSVEEVPAELRRRLLKTTSGSNADTILIADRKGREEINKAIRKMPGSAPRRQFGAILAAQPTDPDPLRWLTPLRRRLLGLLGLLGALGVACWAFLYHWK